MIGDNIKRLMKEKGYTQRQLAELCGCTESSICHYIKNESEPRVKTLKRLAAVLCVTVDELIEDRECGTCERYDECSPYVTPDETFPEVGGCGRYAKAPSLELVSRAIKDYCYSLICAGKDSVEVTEFNADFQCFLKELYENGKI